MNKKYSIILPFYNAEDTIQATLESIVQQISEDMEILCVNDCSTDSSLTIVNKYSKKYSQIKVFSLDSNSGVSKARNVALNNAKGEFVLFVDADDLVPKNFFQFLTRYKFKEECDLLLFSYGTIFQQTNVGYTYPDYIPVTKLTVEECQDAIIGIKKEGELIPTRLTSLWAKVFRREIIENKQLRFDSQIRIGEDSIFVFDYLQYVREIYFCAAMAYCYFQNSRSLTHSFQPQMIENDVTWQLALSKHLEKFTDKARKEKYQYYSLAKGILNICYLFIGHKDSYFSWREKRSYLKKILENLPYKDLWRISSLRKLLASFSFQERLLLYLLKQRKYSIVIGMFQFRNRINKMRRKYVEYSE